MRTTVVVVALGAALVACGPDGPDAGPTTVITAPAGTARAGTATGPPTVAALEAQSCDRPQPRRGVATFLADDLAITAGHLVEGELRRLDVDGRPGEVVALDRRLDLALVTLDPGAPDHVPDPGVTIREEPEPGPVELLRPIGDLSATITRALTLRVNDVTDGVTYERPALELDLVVGPGDSGSPVVDADGALLGVVVLRRQATGVSYATPVPPLDELDRTNLAPATGCA